MNKKAILASTILAICLVVGALLFTNARKPATTPKTAVRRIGTASVSKASLSSANGQDGAKCYVAIDATVYEIADQPDWQRGKHTTSKGLAYCGANLSSVIDQAPHGRKILDQLDIVGKLK